MISADSNIYFFSKNLQLVSTIPQVETSDALSHVVILYFQEPKGSGVQCSVNMYDNKNFKLLGRYQLLDCDGFEFEKGYGKKHKPFFKISHLQNGKPTVSVIDTTGKLILSHVLPPESTLNNLEVCINKKGRLFGLDDYPSELVYEYYKGKNFSGETKNIYLLTKKENDPGTEHWKVYSTDGTLINDFGKNAKIDAEEANFRTGEISYMTLLSNDSVNGAPEYLIDNSFQNRGKLIKKYREENEIYLGWHRPQNDKYLMLTERNNQLELFSPYFNKQITVFTPDPSNVYNSKGMIPVSDLLHGTFFMYKENDSYGMYNLFKDKKTPLFNFPLKDKTAIEEVEVKEKWPSLTFEINISLRGANEETSDTTFYYLLTSKGDFKKLAGEAGSLSPWRAYDTINREQVSFDLDFLYMKTNQQGHLKILNRDGKELLDLKDDMLYCVGTNYLGLSEDGKTSTLFDMKLKQVKKKIPGIVCASIEGPDDLLCFEKGVYSRYKSGKFTPLFTENELMGWEKNFVNNPDNDNYQERQMIVHVMKQGNFLVMYQNVPTENSFKMSLYDLQNARLHTCLKQQFLDFTEELSMYPPLYADRFMFASPQEPKVKCFEGIYKPKIKADTLMLALYIPQDQELLGPEFRNAYLFLSKTSSNVYFGTIDSIYYTFKSQPDITEWDCGIYIFGDSETGFYLLDTAKKQLSKDKYAKLDTDMENSCLNDEFAATNMRTGKRELFRLTDKGHQKLMEGNFQSFTRSQSPKDGFGRSGAFYLFFNSNLQFVTDDKFNLVFDTTKYVADPEGDYTTLTDNGGNFMVLKGKGSDENYYVVNALTKEITKMNSKPQPGYVEHFLVLESKSGSGDSVDLLLVETGEVMKNVNLSKGEYFVFNGKLYFQENVENDSSHLYNSSGQRIK